MDVTAGPDPFRRSTRVSYAVPHRGKVSLVIFDAVGRNVRTLVDGRSEPGRFSAVWDGRSQSGALVPGGVYLYRYALDGTHMTGKLMLTR
jgi:flagellar hook assembly protein FlgD